ncbi:MAG: PAS domain S-box protein [Bacteroidetes bacterium]|nr:PAS domain S-box protein [Bacteroidota bacterium]
MEKRIKLLMLEDSIEDAEIVRNELAKTGLDFVIKLVDNKDEFEKMLNKFKPDIILSDYLMPGFNGLAALEIVKEKGFDIPYIFVSGHIGEDLAIEALHRGATDYVLKDKLTKLVPAITRVLKEKEEHQKRNAAEIALKESEEKYRTVVNSLNIILFILDNDGTIIFVQGKGLEALNLKAENLVGSSIIGRYSDIQIQMADGINISGKDAFQKVLKGYIVHGISKIQNRYQEVKLVPQRNIYNVIIRIVGIANDITELILVSDRLRESEDRYRSIYENAPIGILSISHDGKFLNANPAFQQIIGYNENELQNLSFNEITFDDDLDLSKKALDDLYLNNKDYVQFEKRYVKKNKEVVWTNLTATAVRDAQKKLLYTISMVEDISKKKKAEDKLRESENRYRLLFERNLAGVFSSTLDGHLFSCNQAFADIFGFSNMEEIYNTHASNLYPNLEKRAEFMNYLKDKRIVKNYELELKKKTGDTIWVLLNAEIVDDPISGDQFLQGTLVDITEKKKAEIEIKESEERFRQLAENISEVFWMSDPLKEKMLYVSPSYEKIWNKTRQELYDNPKAWLESILEEDRIRIEKNYIAKQNSSEYDEEYRIVNSNGTIKWIRDRGFPIRNGKKEIYRIAGIATDITDRKTAIEQIIKAKEKAEEADKLKSEFLAQMSHEIRTPINTILSYNSLIKEELFDKINARWNDAFNSIEMAGKRLIRTIDLILNMSLIQSGKIEIKFEEIDIYPILIHLVNEFSAIAQEKKLEIKLNNIIQDTIIKSEEYIVSQVFQNLIDNAIKYTKSGKVEINIFRNNGKKLCVEIRDTGIGISEKYLLQMFEPFSQEDTGYSRRYEGVGLGLALVKNYIDLIKGKIEVESIKNKGSVFTVIFN